MDTAAPPPPMMAESTKNRIIPLAPAVIAELQFDPAWFGTYVSLSALASLVFQLGCGSFILRYGALRLSQVALVMLAIGLAAGASGLVALFVVSAVRSGLAPTGPFGRPG